MGFDVGVLLSVEIRDVEAACKAADRTATDLDPEREGHTAWMCQAITAHPERHFHAGNKGGQILTWSGIWNKYADEDGVPVELSSILLLLQNLWLERAVWGHHRALLLVQPERPEPEVTFVYEFRFDPLPPAGAYYWDAIVDVRVRRTSLPMGWRRSADDSATLVFDPNRHRVDDGS